MSRIAYSLIFMLLLLSLTGCVRSEDQLLRQAVTNYNKNLTVALKSDTDILKEVATDREQGRIEIFKTQMADEHKMVDAKLQKLIFRNIRILTEKEWQGLISQYKTEHQKDTRIPGAGALMMYKSGALVETDEIWNYQYINTETRQKTGPPNILGYDVTYILVKVQDKWKVTDVSFEEKMVNSK